MEKKKMTIPQIVFTAVFLLCALACVLYGITVYMVHSGTGFFTVWLIMAACFVALAAMSFFRLFHLIPLPVRIAACIILALGFCAFSYTQIRILSCFNKNAPDNLDYLIVLGAQVYPTGPSIVLQYRLDTAVDYLNANPDTLCIVSGGQGPNEEFPEAEGMRDYLIKNGISEDRILLERESLNTIQNILYSKELLKESNPSIGIVTNNFHVYRAMALAKKQGLQSIYGISAHSNPRYLPNNMLREFVGITKDSLLGNMSPF